MARLKMELPDSFIYSTDISLRIADINYGGHLGHDAILSLTHEARVRFFKSRGISELDVFGPGIVLSDVAIVYKSEGFYGDVLTVRIGVADYAKYGCDLIYRLSNKESGKDLALVKTGIVFMNYDERRVVNVPERFRELFPPAEYLISVQK